MDSSQKSTVRSDDHALSLTELDRTAWQQLVSAPTEKKNGFRNLTVITTAQDGSPDGRMVVLRQVDEVTRTLWFHTDVRAQKVAQVQVNPMVLLLFWDEEKQIQLRCRARATIHTTDTVAQEQWDKTWEGNRKMYLSEWVPGSSQPGPYPGFPRQLGENLPSRAESEAGRDHFAAVACQVESVDYLHLSRAGQTRARFTYGESPLREWLAP